MYCTNKHNKCKPFVLTLGYVRDTNGYAGNDVTDELFGSVLPEPVEDGQVDKEKVTPLLPVHGGQESAADRLRNKLQAKVPHLRLTRLNNSHYYYHES